MTVTLQDILQSSLPPGPQGVQGIFGAQGTLGAQGSSGPQGTIGSQGLSGSQGFIGSQGLTGSGSQGAQGTLGSQGLSGTEGAQGAQGTLGSQGLTGSGSQGSQGTLGSQGLTGSGSQGSQGTLGSQGLTGSGSQGSQGTLGSQGLSGTGGSQGSQGTLGSQGLSGTGGSQGTQGTLGSQGVQGTQGPSSTFTVSANVGLAYSSDILSTIYNTTIADGVTSVAVGGATATAASVWKTKNIVQVLDTILFPDQNPTYTVPTLSFSASQSGNKEIGSSISQVTSSTGTENDAGAFVTIAIQRNSSNISVNSSLTAVSTSDIAAQFGYTDPNNPNYTYSHSYTDTFTVVSGGTTWRAFAGYSAGLAKNNNKGVTDARSALVRSTDAPQSACSSFVSATTFTVTGIYPYFYGKSSTQPSAASIASAIAAGSATKVVGDSTGTITITYSASSEYVWLAHVGTSTSKTKWYNTALNNGNIGAGEFILAPVNQNVNSPESYWTGVSFKIYISGFATTTSGSIEFRNT